MPDRAKIVNKRVIRLDGEQQIVMFRSPMQWFSTYVV